VATDYWVVIRLSTWYPHCCTKCQMQLSTASERFLNGTLAHNRHKRDSGRWKQVLRLFLCTFNFVYTELHVPF